MRMDIPLDGRVRMTVRSVEPLDYRIRLFGVLDRANWAAVAESIRAFLTVGVSVDLDVAAVHSFDPSIVRGLYGLKREATDVGAALRFGTTGSATPPDPVVDDLPATEATSS